MFNTTLALHGMSYGCSVAKQCGVMNKIGIITNYGFILICWHRYGVSYQLFCYMLLVAALSIMAYHVDVSLVGLSAIWSFQYGYANNKTMLDHTVFVFSNVAVFVSYYLLPWPWPACFVWKSVMAHCGAAASGWVIARC